MPRLTILALALLVLVVGAPTAQAGWKLNRSLAIAQTVWHPACGQLRVAFEMPPEGVEDAVGWAWAGDCTIRLNVHQHHQDFEPLCHAILHDAGHAASAGHSSNPRSIMYAHRALDKGHTLVRGRRVTTWAGLDPRCRDRGRPYLQAHGQLDAVTVGAARAR